MAEAWQDDVTVVVRSVGERTEDLCRSRLEAEWGRTVRVVRERPFAAAVRAAFEIGLAEARTWTLCVDADVLVARGAIGELWAEARTLPAGAVEIQGRVADRFFGCVRPAGNHLYRTAALRAASRALAATADSLRPEHGLLQRLAAEGGSWHQSRRVVGLHDFGQAPEDVFRKAFVQARKHGELVVPLAAMWRRRATEPDGGDFAVALRGLAAGLTEPGEIRIDVEDTTVRRAWAAAGPDGTEDSAWIDAIRREGEVKRLLAGFRSEPEMARRFPDGMGLPVRRTWSTRWLEAREGRSLVAACRELAGRALESVGRKVRGAGTEEVR